VSLIAVGSLRGAPGVTTLAVALATVWHRRGRVPLILEADPDGGVLAARFGLGHHPSLTDLGVRARAGLQPDDLWEAAQSLPGGVPVVVAHPSADQCQAALRTVGSRLAAVLDDLRHDVIADLGRLRPGTPSLALAEAADVVLLVLRPRLEDVAVAAQRITALNQGGRVRLVLVGERPYPAAEVAAALGVPVLGVIADDVRSATALCGLGAVRGGLARLPLLRSVAALASSIATRLDDLGVAIPETELV